jgi:hypothetical protein
MNELSVAALGPGRDKLENAYRLYGKQSFVTDTDDPKVFYVNGCVDQLRIEVDDSRIIQTIRLVDIQAATTQNSNVAGCVDLGLQFPYKGFNPAHTHARWTTGQAIAPLSPCASIVSIYGEPDSRRPSTKSLQPLELLYYTFDWAGPDVPQVMEVVCTPPKAGAPGRVVEITLVAGSL